MIEQLQEREPALLMGIVTFIGGFLAQVGPGAINDLRALGTSATASGLQALLARESVYSPASAKALINRPLARGEIDTTVTAPGSPQHGEPALLAAAVAGFAAFLLQIVGHKASLSSAFGTSAGIAALQGLLTRRLVWSPGSVGQARWRTTVDGILAQVRA